MRWIALTLLVVAGATSARGTALPAQGPAEAQAPRAGRVISLIPAVTEMLFAIGAGEQVIAVSSFDRYPPAVEKLTRVGALIDPDLEKILSLRPDLVVVYRTQTELQEQLQRAGIATFLYTHGGLAEVTATMRQLGSRTGRDAQAEAATRAVERHLHDIRQRVAGRARPRSLLVFGREAGTLRGIYASGGAGFLHDMLETAGGINVFADVRRENVQASTELIIARRPAAILELRVTPLDAAAAEAEARVWSTLASVPAVRSGRVHIIADERMVVPGPRVAEATELMSRVLHPEAWR